VTDAECAELLRWALPRLGLRFEGYRRVRRRVCRRLGRRLGALGLADASAYRRHLEAHPGEWAWLDACCRLPISRFYRDRGVFDALRGAVLPALAEAARRRPDARLRAWSAGCAAGEEAYSVAACFALDLAPRFPGLGFEIVATDADPRLLERARLACYARSSAKELPAAWREALFEPRGGSLAVRDRFRAGVALRAQDLRREAPEGRFDLVLCRNAAFTYFAEPVQREVLARIAAHLRPGGALVIGRHELLPGEAPAFAPWPEAPSTFRFEPIALGAGCLRARGVSAPPPPRDRVRRGAPRAAPRAACARRAACRRARGPRPPSPGRRRRARRSAPPRAGAGGRARRRCRAARA
jgi:chemotaxis protein methyltransferase CheR